MDRRAFIQAAGTALALGAIEACAPAPVAPAAAKPTLATSTAELPTYVPFAGPPADLPGSADGVQPAYFSYAGEQAMISAGVQDPTLALYSPTYANSNAMLQGDFLSGITDIVTGRRPIGDLNTLIADWRTKGGDKMRTEFEQSLSATAG